MTTQPAGKILLVITGSIAAYKSLELIRSLREHRFDVTCVLTRSAEQFVTPLTVASLSGNPVYSELFSLKDETEMGHIRLSREADLVVVAPASANIIAKMASGQCDDLATTLLLATDKLVMVAPAMNAQMWEHPATQRNIAQIEDDGAVIIGPGEGALACGETGLGRMAEPAEILDDILSFFEGEAPNRIEAPLAGFTALVTSGPTYEAIDPVRFIGNRSSGKQGYAIAEALALMGADVTLISGPTHEPIPEDVTLVRVESAEQMFAACEKSLPVDIAICTAAVADWQPIQVLDQKLKKEKGKTPPDVKLKETPDILLHLGYHKFHRPSLVVGFAAETGNVVENAKIKRVKKGCDWIIANDVSGGQVFGASDNQVHLVTDSGSEAWPAMRKQEVALRLVDRIAAYFTQTEKAKKAV